MRTKTVMTLFAVLLLSSCTNSHPMTGNWVGSMEMNGKVVDISLDFNSGNGSLSSKDLMLLDEAIGNVKYKNGNISFSYSTSDVNFAFEGKVENEKIYGTVTIQGMPPALKISFNLLKKSDTFPAKSYSIEKLFVAGKGVKLSAEIFSPQTEKLHPALVLLQGSGGYLKSRVFFDADFFANLGFEVLIFDKRGNGESTGNSLTATYNDLADDAIACLETLKNRKTVDKRKIGLWGISQGAMLLPFIVSKTDIPTFLIAVSPEITSTVEGAAYDDSIRSGNSPENGHIAAESHRKVGEMIRDGSDHKEVETFINQNAQKYSFMNRTALYPNITIGKEEFEGLYWRGRKENFYPYWKNLNISTLVLLGEDDVILNAVRNKTLIEAFHNKKIEIKMFSRANHIMKKSFNPAIYPDFDWPRAVDGYLDFVGNWVEKKIMK